MARFYADENFRYPVTEVLRRLGHDVLTAQDAGARAKASLMTLCSLMRPRQTASFSLRTVVTSSAFTTRECPTWGSSSALTTPMPNGSPAGLTPPSLAPTHRVAGSYELTGHPHESIAFSP